MAEIMAKLRWYPGDPLVEISKGDLNHIAREHGVSISLEEVEGKERQMVGGILREDTATSSIEEVTQTVVTVSGGGEGAFREAVRALIKRYRAPRTTYATWGSTEEGKRIVAEVCDEDDGWY